MSKSKNHAKKFAFKYMPLVEINGTKPYNNYRYRRCTIGLLCIGTLCIFMINVIPHIRSYYIVSYSAIELSLPQDLQCPYENRTKLEQGRFHLSNSRVIICALIRDRESQVPRIRQQIEHITRLFADYAIVIVENDSKDRTRQELINWAHDKKFANRVHIIGCGNIVNDDRSCNLSLAPTPPHHPPELLRIEKMVQLRNIYMKYIEHNGQLATFDYVIVQDFDLRTYSYSDGLLSTGFHFSKNSEIDAICANGMHHDLIFGSRKYFDPYAHKDGKNKNWSAWYNDLWSAFFRYYPCSPNLVHVQSCFSGQTIYRYNSIKGKRYYTYLDSYGQAICEHVGFHKALNIYLNSEMIFYVRENSS